MLTIKTNKNNCKLTYVQLDVSSIVTGETVYDDITIQTNDDYNLRENDEVVLIRHDGESISYFKNAEIKDVIDKTEFTIGGFGNYSVEVNGYKPSFIRYAKNINNITEIDTKTRLYTGDHNVFIITGNTLDSNIIANAIDLTSHTIEDIMSITIGSNIINISDGTFAGCYNLEEINVALNNRNYASDNGVLFNKNKTKLICYPSKKSDTTYNIPTTVEKISDKAFNGASNLINVTIPSFVGRIGDAAFSECANLTDIICKPIAPPIITDTTFDKSTLINIFVKEDQGRRYKTAWKKLKSKISEDTTIVDDIKINQKNTRLYLENGSSYDIVEITGSTLTSKISSEYSDSLVKVEIGTDVINIGDYAFYDCIYLSSVTIPDTVETIGNYSFYKCFYDSTILCSVVIPDSVTSIGNYAFSMCIKLAEVFIGTGVTYIGKHAFYHIYGVNGYRALVYCETEEPPVLGDSWVFRLTHSSYITDDNVIPTFYVPGGSLNKYLGQYNEPINLVSLNSCYNRKYVCLNTNEHIFVTNKDDVNIRRRYLWSQADREYKYDGSLTMCDDDYYLFDDLFLVQNENNYNVSIKNNMLDITASTAGYESIVLKWCLISVDSDGNDDKYHIYVPYSGTNIDFIDKLEDRLPITTFTADDIRFLCNDSSQMVFGCELQPGTNIDKVCGNIEVDFSIGENFEVNLHHNEQIANYIEKVKNNSVNKIIDYERYQYVPMYYDDSIPRYYTADEYLNKHSDEIDEKLKKVNEIKFRLYFRNKYFTLYDAEGNEIDKETGITGATDYVDFETWQTDDTEYWNNYKLRSYNDALDEVYPGLKGDLLGYLGFTDDDVYYQKDAFKKSFLRLSFYDSPNRETQKLLYYSTIYFDTNVYGAKYINDLNAWRENPGYTPLYNQLVFAYDIEGKGKKTSLLTAELSCTDKYDNSSSSDGFYLHLFDKLVSGNTCTPIYMKAEFNNAKFGKTVPLIRPIYGDTNVPIAPTATQFPRQYMKSKTNTSNETYTWTDMNMLLQDMYTKIFIKYNFEQKQFVWFVPQGGLSDTLEFDLFEPRVKGYDTGTTLYLSGKKVRYGTKNDMPNWFQGNFNENGVWVTEDGKTESQWAEEFEGCCLMTTATTVPNENMLNGTKLFNESSLKKIDRIWIDGMMVYSDNVYDDITGEYTTTNIQLPDMPFVVTTAHTSGDTFIWSATTTQEVWNDISEQWDIDSENKPKTIHSVNYYFKTNIKDQVKLIDELYLGTNGNEKTKETTQSLCEQLKTFVPSSPSEALPDGMFSGIQSLKCVKTVINNGHKFTTLGNGAFDNCQKLIRVNINENTIDVIGKNCFTGCKALKEVNLSNTKIILKEAFQGCYTLTKIIFATSGNNTIKYIGCGSFGHTKVRSINLPNSILRIGNSAFRRCYQLHTFKINGSNHALTFGKRVFGDCAILKYNLSRYLAGNMKVRYDYYGGVPDIIQYIVNNNNKIEFYDTYSNKYVRLVASNGKDRGKLMYHYKNENYLKYIDKERTDVLNFEKWFEYIH